MDMETILQQEKELEEERDRIQNDQHMIEEVSLDAIIFCFLVIAVDFIVTCEEVGVVKDITVKYIFLYCCCYCSIFTNFIMYNSQEKQQYLMDMKNKEAEIVAAKEAQDKLMGRIKTMESKLLCGGKNIIDHTNEQQRALEQRTQELLEQKVMLIACIFLGVEIVFVVKHYFLVNDKLCM